jgi:hypothetical protein
LGGEVVNRAPEVVSRIEELGGYLALDADGNIRYRVPKDSPEAQALLATVRAQKQNLLAYLRTRPPLKAPAMPKGVRLIRWEPRLAPVAIDLCSVVVDVPKFIESELQALDSRLNNPWTIHGGFTIPQMLDRLAQVGVLVGLEDVRGVDSILRGSEHGTSEKAR